MGGLLSRAGTDTYYANYEKSFERLEKENSKVLARRSKRRKTMDACSTVAFWVQALGLCIAVLLTAYLQQISSQKWYQKSATILGAFAVPAVSTLLFRAVLWLMRFAEARDERFLRKLMDAKRKMVKDLKDSTRFEKTAALIKKYDPDEQAPKLQATPQAVAPAPAGPGRSGGLRQRTGASTAASEGRGPSSSLVSRSASMTPGAMLIRPAAVAASAAVSVATETGKALMPVFGTLANNLVGDSPALVQEAQQLRIENEELREKVADLEARLAQASRIDSAEEPVGEIDKVPQVAPSG